MKRALLLLLLLPCLCFSQNLATWNTATPTGVATNMTAQTLAVGGGVTYQMNEWEAFGFLTSGWFTVGVENPTIVESKFLEFKAVPNSGYKINASQFKINLNTGSQAARKLQVRASVDGTTWVNLTNSATSLAEVSIPIQQNTNLTMNFPAGFVVMPTETLRVRVHMYDCNDFWNSKNFVRSMAYPNSGNANGPTLTGTVTSAGGVSATADTDTTLENTTVTRNVTDNDFAVNTSIALVELVAPQPVNAGTIALNGSTITFTPAATATTVVRVIGYKITGADGTTATSTYTVTVNPFASPTANADTATTMENSQVLIPVLTNDSAGSGTIGTINITSQPASGSGTATVSDNKILYIPANGFFGNTTISYTVTNSNNKVSNAANVSVTVTPFASPTATADTATTGKNIPVSVAVLSNDVAGSGTIGTINITGQPASGTASVSGSNIVYTPTASFVGTATISYTVTNSNNKVSNSTTLTVNVVNIVAVVANADTASTSKNNAITLNVIANDTPGNSAITTIVVTGSPAHGTAVVNTPANTITYTPSTNFTGTDSFTYKITDAYNTNSSATVSMSVLQPSTTGALCGTYVISATTQYEYPQFPTITAAITHLNANGVSCPVTFLLKDNNYNDTTGESFPLTINQFQGTSATNTVTFKPAPAKNVTIKVSDFWLNGSLYQATSVFQFNGADNIIFDGSNTVNGTTRNLTVFNNNTMNYVDRASFWVASNGSNGANNITIKHTNIRQGYRNQDGRYTIGIFAGSNVIENPDSVNSRNMKVNQEAGANNGGLYIWNNDFMNVKQGVYINGGGTITTGVTILQNDLGAENNTETIILPVTLNNVSNFNVSENLVYRLYRTTTDGDLLAGGINIKGSTTNGSITKNNMKDMRRLTADAHTFAGIVLASTSTTSNILIANNFILDPVAKGNGGDYSNGYGIIVDNGGGYRILNNTVVLHESQEIGGFSAALYVNINASNLDVRNNIFVNTQSNTNTRRCAIMVNKDVDNLNAVFTKLDYNNYYSVDRIGYIANSESLSITWPENPDFVTTLGGWQSALANTNNSTNINNKDTHSISINPVFMSASDLHLATANSAMNDKGMPIAEIPKDIDGQLRSTSVPDIGADEFGVIEIPMPEPGSNAGIYCTSSTTWNGTAWSNGNPAADKDVIFTGNKTFNAEDVHACSIFVYGNAQVNFMGESNAYVTHNVNVATTASLTFESSCHILQSENAQNNGIVTIKRNSSKLKRLDYVMWGSPVFGEQSLLDFSPNTLLNRFYTYNNSNNLYSPIADPSAVTFAKAKGYLIRMPNNHSTTTPTVFEGVFEGVPNNGNVYFPLQYSGTSTAFNAVGNPYPSPISVTAFIDGNIDNIEGTLWVWRKTNDHNQSSYSTMTKTGYTANAAPGGDSEDNELIADPFEIAPDVGALNTAQGFIVKAKTTQNLVFRNNMRLDLNYNNFFRTAADAQTVPVQFEMSRIWLNVKGNDTDFSQALIAYSPQTTLGYDNGFDGKALSGANVDLSSIIYEDGVQMKLSIQARPEFTIADVVQLGFTAEVAGTFTFEIDHVDGLFLGDQAIYLVDNLTGAMHNLKNSNYSFSTEIGTFDERFEIVYATEEELGIDTPVAAPAEIMVYRDGNKVSIKSSEDIKAVAVYDMLGKMLYNNNNVDATAFTTAGIESSQQVIIVNVTLNNNQVVSKKIMMN